MEEKALSFSAKADKEYKFNITLQRKINVDESKFRTLGHCVEIILKKAEETKDFWTSLNEGPKLPYLKIDWERWVDEDDDEKPIQSIPNFGMGDFAGMGGMGGMGGMDFSQYM